MRYIDGKGCVGRSAATIEFTKDLKLNVVVKEKDMEVKFDGTYKVEKDVLTTITIGRRMKAQTSRA